jgi:hypothetical protein
VSLLDRGREAIQIYHVVYRTDRDGNPIKALSTTPEAAKATIQPAAQSGTSARRAEQDNEGYESEEVYRMRLPRSYTALIDSGAQIEWRGARWHITGKPRHYNGSRRTAHTDYIIRRT